MSKQDANPLMGESPDTVALRELIAILAPSASTVLITGESGTGKELVARALHAQSPRSEGPFVPINCGAIPKELIESELFGHRKGAFTGAVADRLGRFELAHGGTLFLDEIGDLPLDLQVKLLRVLQERCILPVGSSKEVRVDVRVVAATHRKLDEEVEQGRFREDLYYRINVLPVFTTPLRQRPLDIPVLMRHYAGKFKPKDGSGLRFSPQMMALLSAYAWPGNVRELSNLVDRFSTLFPDEELFPQRIPACMLPPGLAQLQSQFLQESAQAPAPALAEMVRRPKRQSAMADQVFQQGEPELQRVDAASDALPPWLAYVSDDRHPVAISKPGEMHAVEEAVLMAQGIPTLPPEGLSLKQHLVDVEKNLIEQALRLKEGNVSQTARILQLQRTTLIEKINKYDLRVAD
jgi:sigma-54 specific flagellar transcriptional regulator A